ncbi:MAG: hypothetical protein AAGF12_19310 [Myxococcota bacterium]
MSLRRSDERALVVACSVLVSLTVARSATAQDEAVPDEIKVTVIVSGDPEPSLTEAARALDRAIDQHPEMRRPFDPGVRNALLGDPGNDDDGLSRLRGLRRGLGLSETQDLRSLLRMGTMTGADALAIVRMRNGDPEVVVVDVVRESFFRGSVALPSDDAVAFILARAQPAARARAEEDEVARAEEEAEERAQAARERAREEAREAEARAEAEADAHQAATRAEANDVRAREEGERTEGEGERREGADAETTGQDEDSEDGEEEPGFFEKYWPYLVGALLLGAVIVWFSLPSDTADQGAPVLRFIPGGSP